MARDDELDFDRVDERRWVRMYTLFGKSIVPPDAAEVIEQAVEKAIDVGDVKPGNAWQLVEFWAADYLAGSITDRQQEVQQAAELANDQLDEEYY